MLRSRKTGSSTSTTTTTTQIPRSPSTDSKPIDDMMLRSTKKDKMNSKVPSTPSKNKPKSATGSQQWGNLAFAIANAKKAAENAALSHQKEYAKNAKVYRMKLCIYTVMCLGLIGVGWVFYPSMEPAAKQFYAEHKEMLEKPQELLRGAMTTSPGVDDQGNAELQANVGEVMPGEPQHKTKADVVGEADKDDAGHDEEDTSNTKTSDVPGSDLIGASMPKACVTKIFRRGRSDFHDGTVVVDCHEFHYKAHFDGMQNKLMIGVLSTTYRQRMFIRQSWAKLTNARVYFIVNGPFSRIEKEYNENNDLIFIDKPSNQPKNPTINTIAFLMISEQHGGSFENVLLTTDDVFVDVKSLEKKLANGNLKRTDTGFPTRLISRAFSKCAVNAASTEVDTLSEPFSLLDLMAKDCGMPNPHHIESNSQIKDESTMQFFFKQAKAGGTSLRG